MYPAVFYIQSIQLLHRLKYLLDRLSRSSSRSYAMLVRSDATTLRVVWPLAKESLAKRSRVVFPPPDESEATRQCACMAGPLATMHATIHPFSTTARHDRTGTPHQIALILYDCLGYTRQICPFARALLPLLLQRVSWSCIWR